MENQVITVTDLIAILLEYQENQGKNIPIFISEKVIDGFDNEKTIIRQMNRGDIVYEKDLEHTAAFIVSQVNEGVVIGFVPTIE